MGQATVFTVPKACEGSLGLSWRWMDLTAPPCKHVTIWPYPASVETVLGRATIDKERHRGGEYVVVENEAGVKVRDVLGKLEDVRGPVPFGVTFRVMLNGVVHPPDMSKVEVIEVSAEEQQPSPNDPPLVLTGSQDDSQQGAPSWEDIWLFLSQEDTLMPGSR